MYTVDNVVFLYVELGCAQSYPVSMLRLSDENDSRINHRAGPEVVQQPGELPQVFAGRPATAKAAGLRL
jgi:hypothetical protein